jgi:hypothetical protein
MSVHGLRIHRGSPYGLGFAESRLYPAVARSAEHCHSLLANGCTTDVCSQASHRTSPWLCLGSHAMCPSICLRCLGWSTGPAPRRIDQRMQICRMSSKCAGLHLHEWPWLAIPPSSPYLLLPLPPIGNQLLRGLTALVFECFEDVGGGAVDDSPSVAPSLRSGLAEMSSPWW